MGLVVGTALTVSGVTFGAGADAWSPSASAQAASALNASGGTDLSCAASNDDPAQVIVAFQSVPLIENLDTVRGFTVALRQRDGAGVNTTLEQVQLRVAGATLSADKAVSQVVPAAYATLTLGGASDLWSLSVTAENLNDGLELLLRYGTSASPLISLDQVAATVHWQSRQAVIDHRLVGRTLLDHLRDDINPSYLRVLGPGEEPQPEWPSGGDMPWVQLSRVELTPYPVHRGGTEAPDVRGLAAAVSVGVPDELTRSDFWALEMAMARVRRALDHRLITDSGATHRIHTDEVKAEMDGPDPDARVRTGVVTVTGVVVRTEGRLFDDET